MVLGFSGAFLTFVTGGTQARKWVKTEDEH